MRIAVFSTKGYDQESLRQANEDGGHGHELRFFEPRLTPQTSSLGRGCEVVCAFVNDQLSASVIDDLADHGTRLVALRSAGFNHVDLEAAARRGLTVVRVPAYSPFAVAEHAAGLILALNRKLHRAYNRVREGNFALDGLMGFDLKGRRVGVVGTGRIGVAFVRIMAGFGCHILAMDPEPSDEAKKLGASFVDRDRLLAESDIIALHCPLTPETYHMINAKALAAMKPGVMIINTSRGALIDTRAAIDALKIGHIGSLGLDVYEEEADLFFEDISGQVIQDDVFARLLTFPNVLITGHQAFFTAEAVEAIATTTMENISAFARGEESGNEVPLPKAS
ncbi:MAG: 2-hydroxyacid dehydrogenase [Phycisphaeraceae bacterium]|nr:2-hydroxyacid dehydrogenase [Phycisphaeraceae bacterium]